MLGFFGIGFDDSESSGFLVLALHVSLDQLRELFTHHVVESDVNVLRFQS